METVARVSSDMTMAHDILGSWIEDGSAVFGGEDDEKVRFFIRHPGWKLSSVVLSKKALCNLDQDPERDVKIAYLQREILRASTLRVSYRYPRVMNTRDCAIPAFARSAKLA